MFLFNMIHAQDWPYWVNREMHNKTCEKKISVFFYACQPWFACFLSFTQVTGCFNHLLSLDGHPYM